MEIDYLGLTWEITVKATMTYSNVKIYNRLLDALYGSTDTMIPSCSEIKSIHFKGADYSRLYVTLKTPKQRERDIPAMPADSADSIDTNYSDANSSSDEYDDDQESNKKNRDPLDRVVKQLYNTAVKLQSTRLEHYFYKQKIEKELRNLRTIVNDLCNGIRAAAIDEYTTEK